MDYKKHGVKATKQEINKITKKGDKMTKQQFDKINNKPSFSKRISKPFIEGANVFVTDAFDPEGEKIESTVLSFDEELDMYTVRMYNGHIESFKSEDVFPWYIDTDSEFNPLPIGTVLLFKESLYPLEFGVITSVYNDRYFINNSDHYILFSDIKKYFIYKPKGDK